MAPTLQRVPTTGGLRGAADRIVPPFLFGFMPLALGIVVLVGTARLPQFLWDFRVFFQAGHDVLHGHSPYPAPNPASLAGENTFVYPPETALLFAPIALLPYEVAGWIFVVVLIVSVLLTLWALRITDWRCYGAAFMMAPILGGIANGALSCLLALGIALAWRFRRNWKAAAAVAGVIVAKVFLWPLLFWLVATKRYAAAAGAVIGGVLVTLLSWAVIGFAGIRDYVHLLRILADLEQAKGFSPIALGLSLGLPSAWARVGALLLGAGALVAVFVLARGPEGDRRSFVAAIGAALALSPIVWLHYFAVLLAVIAVARPRFTLLWLLPVALWLVGGQSQGNAAAISLTFVVAAVTLLLSARSSTAGSARGEAPALAPKPLPSASGL